MLAKSDWPTGAWHGTLQLPLPMYPSSAGLPLYCVHPVCPGTIRLTSFADENGPVTARLIYPADAATSRLATPCAGRTAEVVCEPRVPVAEQRRGPWRLPAERSGGDIPAPPRCTPHVWCVAPPRSRGVRSMGRSVACRGLQAQQQCGPRRIPAVRSGGACPSRTPVAYPSFAAGAMVFVSHSERATLQYA